jgi:uncharacterized protein YbjQ (UPF0145 family)
MLMVTADEIPGKRVKESLGLVIGSTTRSKHIGKDIMAALRNLVGGEIKEYSEMLAEARAEAIGRMLEDAKRKDADAVVAMRLTTSSISARVAEIVAYGTAVKLR